MSIRDRIPEDWPVQPLRYSEWEPLPLGATTCGTCGLVWDDDVTTELTPAPSGRCPFEWFHEDENELAEAGDEDPRTFADIAQHAGIVVEDLQALSPVLLAKGDTATRHLAAIVERLAAQVAELAERLDGAR